MSVFQRKLKKFSVSAVIIAIALIVMLCQGSVFATECSSLSSNAKISLAHPILYGFFAAVALAMMMGYCLLKKKKYLWMLMMLISVFVINVGYMTLSLSKDVYEALLACRISYFGNSFMPLFMLLTLADICRFKIKKSYWYILLGITVVMSGFALSAGYGTLFYKSAVYQIADGNVMLTKEYGILHTIYGIYVYTYYFMSVAIALYSIMKKKILFLRYVTMVIAVSATNLVVWTIEKIIGSSFEFLSVSYVFMEAMLMILYSEMTESGILNCFRMVSDEQDNDITDEKTTDIKTKAEKADNEPVEITESITTDNDIAVELSNRFLKNKFLTKREIEVLVYLLEGKKRKVIADKMFVTENTVKSHITNIYQKFGVSRQTDLCNKIKEIIK